MSKLVHMVQITVDSHDPHSLADWWAEALGWEVELQNEDFIRRMVAAGHASEAETATHKGRLVWTAGAAVVHPEGVEVAPRILFQQVPEPKSVKNRVHLDLRAGSDPVDGEVERLTALGATRVSEAAQGPLAWVVLADPEGNEFCVPVPNPGWDS